MTILLIILCLFFPFLAVLLKKGPCKDVLWAFLLQLLGHVPGVIVKVTEGSAAWARKAACVPLR